MSGVSQIGPRSQVIDRIGRYRYEYNQAVGENIRGGLIGAVSYWAFGSDASFYGAALDQTIAAGTIIKPNRINTKANPDVRSMYRDGTRVFQGEQPPRITAPESSYPHTVIRWDAVNSRIYKATAYGMNSRDLFAIDFALPTFPNGTPRPDHFVPEIHFLLPNPSGGPSLRTKPGIPAYKLDLSSGYNFRGRNVIKQ